MTYTKYRSDRIDSRLGSSTQSRSTIHEKTKLHDKIKNTLTCNKYNNR